jgi:hypothetical protein
MERCLASAFAKPMARRRASRGEQGIWFTRALHLSVLCIAPIQDF